MNPNLALREASSRRNIYSPYWNTAAVKQTVKDCEKLSSKTFRDCNLYLDLFRAVSGYGRYEKSNTCKTFHTIFKMQKNSLRYMDLTNNTSIREYTNLCKLRFSFHEEKFRALIFLKGQGAKWYYGSIIDSDTGVVNGANAISYCKYWYPHCIWRLE